MRQERDEKIEGALLARVPWSVRRRLIIRRNESLDAMAASTLVAGQNPDNQMILLVYSKERIKETRLAVPGLSLADVGVHEIYHAMAGHLWVSHNEDYLKKYAANEKEYKRTVYATECEVNSNIEGLQKGGFIYPARFSLPNGLRWTTYRTLLPEELGEEPKATCGIGKNKAQTEKIIGALKKEAASLGFSLVAPTEEIGIVAITEVDTPRVPRGIRAAIEKALASSPAFAFSKATTRARPHRWRPPGYPGRKRARGPRLLMAVDCSGSTSGDQQRSYYALVRRLLREYKADVAEFTTEICHFGKRPTLTERNGGTDFLPVQQLALKNGYDAVLWFTDGQAHHDDDAWGDKTLHVFVDSGTCEHLTDGRKRKLVKL